MIGKPVSLESPPKVKYILCACLKLFYRQICSAYYGISLELAIYQKAMLLILNKVYSTTFMIQNNKLKSSFQRTEKC